MMFFLPYVVCVEFEGRDCISKSKLLIVDKSVKG